MDKIKSRGIIEIKKIDTFTTQDGNQFNKYLDAVRHVAAEQFFIWFDETNPSYNCPFPVQVRSIEEAEVFVEWLFENRAALERIERLYFGEGIKICES